MKALHYIFALDQARASSESHWAIDRIGSGIKTALRAAAAVVLLTGTVALPSPASAAVVTQWDFVVHSGFTAFGPAGVTGSNNNAFLTSLPVGGIPALGGGNIGPFAAAPTLLRWGVSAGSGQSSLSAGSPTGTVVGSVNTNGPAANTLVISHANNPIFSPFLETAVLTSVLFLEPAIPPGAQFQLPAVQFDISFTETLNLAPCVAPGGPACSDIFVVDVAGAGFNSGDNSFEQPFIGPMGVPYIGKLSITGLTTLTSEQCIAAGVDPGCQGFITEEGNTNEFQATLAIAAVPIPAAGILFLTALAGLGAVARRRKSKAV